MDIKETKIGFCISDFAPIRLKDFLSHNDAGKWGSDPNGENDISVVRSTNFNDTGYLNLSDVALRSLSEDDYDKTKLLENDIVIERSGGSANQPVGRVSFITKDIEDTGFGFSNFIQRIRVSDEYNAKYVFYCLYHLHSAGITQTMQTQTNGIRNLEYRYYLNQKFPKPELKEQNAIVHYLSSVDNAIQATKNSIEKLEKLKTSLMQNLLTGKMRPDGSWRNEDEFYTDEKFGKVPKGWVVMKLRNCLTEKPKYGANASAVEFDKNLPKYIRITDIDDNGYIIPENKASITVEDAKGNYLENNDFLFARTGDTVGKSFLYKSEFGLCAFAGYMIRFKIDENILNPDLLNLIARSPIFEIFKGSVKTIGAKPNINANEYSRFRFSIPEDPEEQNLMYSTFKIVEDSIFTRKNKIKALEQSKKSLMQNLLTGKIRIPIEQLK